MGNRLLSTEKLISDADCARCANDAVSTLVLIGAIAVMLWVVARVPAYWRGDAEWVSRFEARIRSRRSDQADMMLRSSHITPVALLAILIGVLPVTVHDWLVDLGHTLPSWVPATIAPWTGLCLGIGLVAGMPLWLFARYKARPRWIVPPRFRNM